MENEFVFEVSPEVNDLITQYSRQISNELFNILGKVIPPDRKVKPEVVSTVANRLLCGMLTHTFTFLTVELWDVFFAGEDVIDNIIANVIADFTNAINSEFFIQNTSTVAKAIILKDEQAKSLMQ